MFLNYFIKLWFHFLAHYLTRLIRNLRPVFVCKSEHQLEVLVWGIELHSSVVIIDHLCVTRWEKYRFVWCNLMCNVAFHHGFCISCLRIRWTCASSLNICIIWLQQKLCAKVTGLSIKWLCDLPRCCDEEINKH